MINQMDQLYVAASLGRALRRGTATRYVFPSRRGVELTTMALFVHPPFICTQPFACRSCFAVDDPTGLMSAPEISGRSARRSGLSS